MVKIKNFVAPAGAAAIAFAMIIGTAASASATNNIKPFGVQETLKESGGAVEIGYTVDGLSPSTDMVPYPVNGQLYEARVTVDGVAGWVNPVIGNFNARALSGDNYRVLTVVTPDGLSPAPVPRAGSPAENSTSTWSVTYRTASSTTTDLRTCWPGSTSVAGSPYRTNSAA